MKISSNWSAPVKQSGHFSVKIGRKTKTLRCSLSPVLCVWLNWNIQVAKTERPRRERNHLSVPPCLPKWKRVKRKTSFPPCGQRSFKKTLCDTCTATSNSAAVSWTLVWVQNQNAKREKSPWGRQGERGRTGRTFFYLFSVTESTQPLWSDTLQTLHRHTHTHRFELLYLWEPSLTWRLQLVLGLGIIWSYKSSRTLYNGFHMLLTTTNTLILMCKISGVPP